MKTPQYRTLLAAVSGLALFALPAAFAGHDVDHKFKKFDADGDGKVTRAEHSAGAREMFTKSDANNDGILTAAELDATASKEDKSDKHYKSAADKIKLIDANGDGQLTLAEHDAGSEKIFAKLDVNSDGSLSKEELHDGHKELKKSK